LLLADSIKAAQHDSVEHNKKKKAKMLNGHQGRHGLREQNQNQSFRMKETSSIEKPNSPPLVVH